MSFSFFKKLFSGDSVERFMHTVALINHEEKNIRELSDEVLKEASQELQRRIRNGETEDAVLPRAFALVREASRRTLKQRHYDVQLIGGMVLHEGKIAEMLTGEGKTLVATLPAYLNALSGKGVHVITVNDYLAKRDTVWMGQIYNALGLSVACIVHDTSFIYDPTYQEIKSEIRNPKSETNFPLRGISRRETKIKIQNDPEQISTKFNGASNSKIKNELDETRDAVGGFKVVQEFLKPVSRREAYAADIVYGTNHEFGFDFLRDNLVLDLCARVQHGHHYAIIDEVDSILIDEARTPLIISAPDAQSSAFYKTFARAVERLHGGSETDIASTEDYVVDEKLKVVNITEPGIEKVEKMLGVNNIFAPEHSRLVHFLQESLKAKELFKRDRDYVVKDGEIIIVDEFTGRMLFGRRYSHGLHQAIEAKEGVAVKEENRTYAQITIQNYFRLYKKIGGMTGTAQTSAEEFHKVYHLDVVSIPPNKQMIRQNLPDLIYKTKKAKYEAVVKEVQRRHDIGQPMLIGTTSITNNEVISEYLSRAGIPHEVLNAKNHEREGEIIAQAGKRGGVTVATNMAGRGVDIILGGNPPSETEAEFVRSVGGLHVIGTERHEARRIDNQLRGRAGRQGDPGSNQFFLSLEDDLLRIFGGDRIQRLMETFNFPEDVPIESKMVSKSVNEAQRKVEGANFDMRRHLLDFDDVLNKQRTAFYAKRTNVIEMSGKNEIMPFVRETLVHFVEQITHVAEKNRETLNADEREKQDKEIKNFEEKLKTVPEKIENERAILVGQFLVRMLDALWIDHLENLESLRESVNIRAYGQHEPIVEYRRDAHHLFQDMNRNFESLVFGNIFPLFAADLSKMRAQPISAESQPKGVEKIGRNDPCWCGAKKQDGTPIKHKHCHGRNA